MQTSRVALILISILYLASLTSNAQKQSATKQQSSKEHVFEGTRDQIYAAAVAVAKEHYTLLAAIKDEGVLTYQTGYSLTSNGFQVTATFEQTDGGILVRLRPAKKQQLFAWGAGDRIAKKFFAQMETELSHQK